MLTSFAPLRMQIRQMLSETQAQASSTTLLSLRWPRCWAGDRSLGFDVNATPVSFAKSSTFSARQVAVRSRAVFAPAPVSAQTEYKINLDGCWTFADALILGLISIEVCPSLVSCAA